MAGTIGGGEIFLLPWRAMRSAALRVIVEGGGFLGVALRTGCSATAGAPVVVEGMMGLAGAAFGIDRGAEDCRCVVL